MGTSQVKYKEITCDNILASTINSLRVHSKDNLSNSGFMQQLLTHKWRDVLLNVNTDLLVEKMTELFDAEHYTADRHKAVENLLNGDMRFEDVFKNIFANIKKYGEGDISWDDFFTDYANACMKKNEQTMAERYKREQQYKREREERKRQKAEEEIKELKKWLEKTQSNRTKNLRRRFHDLFH